MDKIVLNNPWAPVRTLVIGLIVYPALVALLRVAGKRTLGKMNAFDLIVTVALGSSLASVLISHDIALVQGLTALSLLIGLQFAVSWLSVRQPAFHRFVTGDPALLLYQGQMLRRELRRERVTDEEVRAAIRSAGAASVEEVLAVVLETDGSFSVIPNGSAPKATALQDVPDEENSYANRRAGGEADAEPPTTEPA